MGLVQAGGCILQQTCNNSNENLVCVKKYNQIHPDWVEIHFDSSHWWGWPQRSLLKRNL